MTLHSMGCYLLTEKPMSKKNTKRAHILSSVNAANVSKAGSTYTIKDVCGAVDDIVMNSTLYAGDQLAAGVATLEGKPAPAGHPRNTKGQAISALNGEAMLTSYIGAVCRNARHEGGRTLVDIIVNEAQARAHADGVKLVERLDAAITGTNAEPIHVSTGLYFEPITTNGEIGGKKYSRIATSLRYDHLAILLNEKGAGTPEQGVGMFLNEEGIEEEVEEFVLNTEPEDKRSAGLLGWIKRLVGNGSTDVSFDAISSALHGLLGDGAWLREVFSRYAIWTDRDGKQYQQDYSISSDGSIAFVGQAVEVTREVTYRPITNTEADQVKTQILAALNAAGIAVAGLDDTQILAAYNSLVTKPVEDKLTAANSKLVGLELAANAAVDAEATALATELTANTSLSVDDLKKLGLPRLKELKATNAKAAPVVPAGSTGATNAVDEFAGYDLNSLEA